MALNKNRASITLRRMASCQRKRGGGGGDKPLCGHHLQVRVASLAYDFSSHVDAVADAAASHPRASLRPTSPIFCRLWLTFPKITLFPDIGSTFLLRIFFPFFDRISQHGEGKRMTAKIGRRKRLTWRPWQSSGARPCQCCSWPHSGLPRSWWKTGSRCRRNAWPPVFLSPWRTGCFAQCLQSRRSNQRHCAIPKLKCKIIKKKKIRHANR